MIQSNCCNAPFGYPGWPDSDLCVSCGEHAEPDTEEEIIEPRRDYAKHLTDVLPQRRG